MLVVIGLIVVFLLLNVIPSALAVANYNVQKITSFQWIYTIIFFVALIFILLAAFNFLTGRGNEKKIRTAKKQLRCGVIGIVIFVALYFALRIFLELNPYYR